LNNQSLCITAQTKPHPLKAQGTPLTPKGYGLILLLVFIASTVLTVTSLSMILIPSAASYIGSASLNNAIGENIATLALDAAQNDIISKLSNGNTVDTSYRYPASGTTTVSIPSYPGSGATSAVGSYFVTVTKTRGQTYILQATVAYNNTTSTISRLVQLSGSSSLYKNAYAAYSLRRLYSSYSGKAVNVRCATTSTSQDIGFTASGDFDVSSLRTCLGEDLPLNVDSTAKAAYSLRKLSTGYSGKAIKVRSSAAGNPTQDIGFNSFGNLDTKSLLSFVGTNSGYIDTWYDQSGNGLNLTQATTANQPRIVNAGVIDTKNGIPSVYFSGGTQNLSNMSVSGVISGSELRAFAVVDIESGSNVNGELVSLHKTGDASDYGTTTSMETLVMEGSLSYIGSNFNNGDIDTSWTSTVTPTGSLFQVTSYHDASSNAKIFLNGTNAGTHTSFSLNLAPNSLMLGAGAVGGTVSYQGYFSELVIYSSAVTSGNQSKIEHNQDHYYGISGYTDGFVTKWYDQSGHGYDLAQATTTGQPFIDVSGSAPAVYIDPTGCSGSSANCDYLTNSSSNVTLSPMTATVLAVGQLSTAALSNPSWAGELFGVYQTGTSVDRNSNSVVFINQQSGGPPIKLGSIKDNDTSLSISFNLGQDFQVTSFGDGTNRKFRCYQTSGGLTSSSTATNAGEGLVVNYMRVGINDGLNSNANWEGRVNEIIFWTSALGSSTYQSYETAQRNYYGI